jgi:hypothetical protein
MKVGQTVWVKEVRYRNENPELVEAMIESIGRKYFAVSGHYRRFCIDTKIEDVDSNYRARIYLDKEEYESDALHQRLSLEIRDKLRGYGKINLPLDTLKEIAKLLN